MALNLKKRFAAAYRAFFGPPEADRSPDAHPEEGQENTTGPRMFVSYSHRDKPAVDAFAAYLEQEEIPPWTDNQLRYGESWDDVIVEKLTRCSVVIVLMSPEADESEYVHKEIALAREHGKIVIPVLIRGEALSGLEALQHIDLLNTIHTKSNFIEQLRDLVNPGVTPSPALQKRRLEDFCLALFRLSLGVPATNVHVGFGLAVDHGITLDQTTAEMDELDWAEVFSFVREKLPHKDLDYVLGKDYGALYPTVGDFAAFLEEKLEWEDVRKLCGKLM